MILYEKRRITDHYGLYGHPLGKSGLNKLLAKGLSGMDSSAGLPDFGALMTRILSEYRSEGSALGISNYYRAQSGARPIFGGWIETPFGPAEGVHTRRARGIVSAYLTGSRFFELARPRNPREDAREHIHAWFALKLISRELALGSPEGFVFAMTAGGEEILAGEAGEYLDAIGGWEVMDECAKWSLDNLHLFSRVEREHIEALAPPVSRAVILDSRGLGPIEIENAAENLLRERAVHVLVRLGPEIIGEDIARERLSALGYGDLQPDVEAFRSVPGLDELVASMERLRIQAGELGLQFGIKIAGALPVLINGKRETLSGHGLFPFAAEAAARAASATGGALRVSFSGGADAHNMRSLIAAGAWPVTMTSALLRAGGYERTGAIAEELSFFAPFAAVGANVPALRALADDSLADAGGTPPAPPAKNPEEPPLFGCASSPCRVGCPIGQDIPAYLRFAREERWQEALRVIIERNPLPNITGSICTRECAISCRRGYYEGAVDARAVKLEAAFQGHRSIMRALKAVTPIAGRRAAVVGGGPAGLAAASLLARSGLDTTLFEKRERPGGAPRHIIPEFRIEDFAIERDVQLTAAVGVKIETGVEIMNVESLRQQGFTDIIIATGSRAPGETPLGEGAIDARRFLEQVKEHPAGTALAGHVVVAGDSLEAPDAARAARRIEGVESVTLAIASSLSSSRIEAEANIARGEGVVILENVRPAVYRAGRLEYVSGAGEALSLPADAVIAAPARLPDVRFANEPGVHIVGEARRGAASVAEAIADAQELAREILGVRFDSMEGLNRADRVTGLARHWLQDTFGEYGEAGRCLECASVCDACVEVCPNRANVSVRTLSGGWEVVHLDDLCDGCGACERLCPWERSPRLSRPTFFTDEARFASSDNEGALVQNGGIVKTRLNQPSPEAEATFGVIAANYGYLFKIC